MPGFEPVFKVGELRKRILEGGPKSEVPELWNKQVGIMKIWWQSNDLSVDRMKRIIWKTFELQG